MYVHFSLKISANGLTEGQFIGSLIESLKKWWILMGNGINRGRKKRDVDNQLVLDDYRNVSADGEDKEESSNERWTCSDLMDSSVFAWIIDLHIWAQKKRQTDKTLSKLSVSLIFFWIRMNII